LPHYFFVFEAEIKPQEPCQIFSARDAGSDSVSNLHKIQRNKNAQKVFLSEVHSRREKPRGNKNIGRITLSRLLISLSLAGLIGISTVPQALAQSKQTDEKANIANTENGDSTNKPKIELLHFGNMGGLLPTLSVTDLPQPDSEGAILLDRFCKQCHNLPGAGLHTAKEWGQTFWRMFWRMHLMASQYQGFDAPNYQQGTIIYTYLLQNSLQAVKQNDVSAKEVGARPYMRICYQCHQLPNPKMHKKAEWRHTVRRMNDHMRSMGKLLPSRQEFNEVVQYLENNAAK